MLTIILLLLLLIIYRVEGIEEVLLNMANIYELVNITSKLFWLKESGGVYLPSLVCSSRDTAKFGRISPSKFLFPFLFHLAFEPGNGTIINNLNSLYSVTCDTTKLKDTFLDVF